jgi:hypothetical protein
VTKYGRKNSRKIQIQVNEWLQGNETHFIYEILSSIFFCEIKRGLIEEVRDGIINVDRFICFIT